MFEQIQEAFLLAQLERLVDEAVEYSLSRLRTAGFHISRNDIPRLLESCLRAMEGEPGRILTPREAVFQEFYKFVKKYLEDRVWYFVWRLLSLRGVRIRGIFIADRVGGEGLRSRRPEMGRDIDYLVIVEGDLRRAREAAGEVEDLLNRTIGGRINELLRRVSRETLKECKLLSLIEIDVFSDEREARAWAPLREIDRGSYLRVRARELFSSK